MASQLRVGLVVTNSALQAEGQHLGTVLKFPWCNQPSLHVLGPMRFEMTRLLGSEFLSWRVMSSFRSRFFLTLNSIRGPLFITWSSCGGEPEDCPHSTYPHKSHSDFPGAQIQGLSGGAQYGSEGPWQVSWSRRWGPNLPVSFSLLGHYL